VLVDVGLGESRCDTSQPTVYLGIVSPCHRHEAERRVDRKALSDNVFTVAGVAHCVDDGQVVVVDARHRAADGQVFVEIDQCGSALLEQGKLVAKTSHQPEQPTAEPITAIVVASDPSPAFEFGKHQCARRCADAELTGQLSRGQTRRRRRQRVKDIHRPPGRR
jgi:hypothetical protein